MPDTLPHTDAYTADTLEAARIFFAGPAIFTKGVVNLSGLPAGDRTEVAFAGRSNVGKSSLINAITGRKGLARSSAEPGKTREINYFDLGEGQLYLVDLPGFGYAKVSKTQARQWMALTRDYLSGRASLRRVFLLIDARRGVMTADTEVMDLLDTSAVTYQLVLTKIDKIKPSQADALSDKLATTLGKRPAAHPVIARTSSEKGWGIAELRAEIVALL
ncbi:MAG: ribosome biogenesis GTP-binding protein YihA/YsxC [Pseudomonadota bacterium]